MTTRSHSSFSAHAMSLLIAVGAMAVTHAALAQTTTPGAPEGPPPQPLPHPELPAVPLPPSVTPAWVWIVAGVGLALLLGIVLLWLFTRPTKVGSPPPTHPRRDALAALAALRLESSTLPPPTVAAQVSMILRSYLEQRYHIPAPCRTTPELFSAAAKPTPLPSVGAELFIPRGALPPAASSLKPFAPLAEFWDRLAFAPAPATQADALQLIDTAHTRIQEDPA